MTTPTNQKSAIVYNDKGGVGKSLATLGIMLAAVKGGLTLHGVEAESEPRLARRYPQTFEHVQIDDATALLDADANRAVAQFDPIFNRLADGGALIDMGANTAGKMLSILAASGADAFVGEGENVALVIVSTAEAEAIDAAIANATAAKAIMPKARRFFWANEYRGALPDESSIITAMREEGFEIIRIGACRAASWPLVRDRSIVDLARIDRAALTKLGIEPAPAARDAQAIKNFVQALSDAAQPVVDFLKA
jgi:hypothetical protein